MRRLKFPGEQVLYHCMSKIVGQAFLLGRREKEVLRKQIWQVADFCGVEVLAYCVMDNHFHILARTPRAAPIETRELERRAKVLYGKDASPYLERLSHEDAQVRMLARAALLARMGDVSLYMKELKQRFSIWYNRNHGRLGTLWCERFKSVLVEDSPMARSTVAAYIDLNPVRAGLVDDPAAYRFCSYGEAMGGAYRAARALCSLAGGRIGMAEAMAAYRVVLFGKGEVGEEAGRRIDPEKARKTLASGGAVSLQEALRCRVRYFVEGLALGSAEFVAEACRKRSDAMSLRRRGPPLELQGCDWKGLHCAKGMRKLSLT